MAGSEVSKSGMDGEEKTTTLSVKLRCGGCVKTCTELLNAVDGVKSVDANLEGKTITVKHSETVSSDSLAEALVPWTKGKEGLVSVV